MSRSKWAGLVELVPRLRREVAAAPVDLPLRERAAWVTYASFLGSTDPAQVAAGAAQIAADVERLAPDQRVEVMHDLQSRLGAQLGTAA